jgi:hypothetical protein
LYNYKFTKQYIGEIEAILFPFFYIKKINNMPDPIKKNILNKTNNLSELNNRYVRKDGTDIYKKSFNNKELKNIIKDYNEQIRTGDIKNPRSEANKFEKYLPTKETANFFKKIKKELGPDMFREALKIQHERGNPAVNVGTDKGLPFHNRKNYNPFTNEVNIPKPLISTDNIQNYLAEVSHAGQPLSGVISKFLKNDVKGYIDAYVKKGNIKEFI